MMAEKSALHHRRAMGAEERRLRRVQVNGTLLQGQGMYRESSFTPPGPSFG